MRRTEMRQDCLNMVVERSGDYAHVLIDVRDKERIFLGKATIERLASETGATKPAEVLVMLHSSDVGSPVVVQSPEDAPVTIYTWDWAGMENASHGHIERELACYEAMPAWAQEVLNENGDIDKLKAEQRAEEVRPKLERVRDVARTLNFISSGQVDGSPERVWGLMDEMETLCTDIRSLLCYSTTPTDD